MIETTFLTIYGARISKNGKYINLTLVHGEGDKKQFYTSCIKTELDAKTYAFVKDYKAVIVVPMLDNDKEKPKEQIDNDGLPF